jgi:DNA-binding transcriptional MerR regulator
VSTDQARPAGAAPAAEKTLTIGSVCRLLGEEFPDISISKIRYLEDQKLVTPKRTQGGYRLYSQDDVERLHTILRLQRDEFLPLRVIRQELATGGAGAERRTGARSRRAPQGTPGAPGTRALTIEELLAETGADADFVRELEEFGIVTPLPGGGERRYGDPEAQIVRICRQMSGFGLGPRHLRQFQSAVQRAAGMLEGVLTPSLRARNADRREAGLEDLATLAALTADLTERILVRDVGRIADRG